MAAWPAWWSQLDFASCQLPGLSPPHFSPFYRFPFASPIFGGSLAELVMGVIHAPMAAAVLARCLMAEQCPREQGESAVQ